MYKNIVGSRIKRARKEAHITQMDLAARLQVVGVLIDRSAIAKLETGKRPASDIEIAAIARVLNVDITWLFKDSESFLSRLSEENNDRVS
jgi:HTH-type transcriptional regulator, cell division transcriptional repressor